MVSGSFSPPCSGYFSPFLHSTGSLSVSWEYLALPGGPGCFRQDSSCPALLRILLIINAITCTRLSLSAVDLSLIGLEPDALERHNYYRVVNAAVGLDAYLRVVKRTVNLVNPTDITFELGQRAQTMGSIVSASNQASNAAVQAIQAELSKTVVTLITANAQITDLTAAQANISSLIATKADIEDLTAALARIDELEAGKITVDWLDATFVRAEDILTGSVTGVEISATKYLTGVTIVGDVIQAETLTAKKLILTGTDGLIYELNAQAGSLTQTQLAQDEYKSRVDGSVLAAHSVTADRINVTDLFAQDITATGTISGVHLEGATGSFSGHVAATTGSIAGFMLDGGSMYCHDTYVSSANTEESVTLWFHGIPSQSERGTGSPNLTYEGAWAGNPNSVAASIPRPSCALMLAAPITAQFVVINGR